MMNKEIEYIIRDLKLERHPEGGWYRQTWRSENILAGNTLPDQPEDRPCSTSIYFLLTNDNFSAFHRIRSDEIWYHHAGDPLEIIVLGDSDHPISRPIGSVVEGYEAQTVAPANRWFASRVMKGGSWSLVGCAVAPGFEFADFELAGRSYLTAKFPGCEELVESLTRLPEAE